MPLVAGIGGWLSGIGALALSATFLYSTFRFLKSGATNEARRVFRFSLFFLPALFLILVLDQLLQRSTGNW
jgi:heme O synthase-like polyprenyltransferase